MELAKVGADHYTLAITPAENAAIRKATVLWAGNADTAQNPDNEQLFRVTARIEKGVGSIDCLDAETIEELGSVLNGYSQHAARYVAHITRVQQEDDPSQHVQFRANSEAGIAYQLGRAAGTLALDLRSALYTLQNPLPDHIPNDWQ